MPEIPVKMLEVDLTTETSKVVDVTEDSKKHLGGAGLGAKFLWERMSVGTDPLSGPENLLYVGVGPMTTLIGTKTSFVFKSPQSEWFGSSQFSGYFGRELIYAGYNAGILITGKAARPSYIYVKDDAVEIRNAEDLWGSLRQKSEYDLRDKLKKETGEMFGVAVIGPAGEHLVRYASITTEYKHVAATWGGGAVMGSKNLKAIAVAGTKGPTYADHRKVHELFTTYRQHPATLTHKYGEQRHGHMDSYAGLCHMAADGVKNQHLGWHDVVLQSNFEKFRNQYVTHVDGCPGCATACYIPFFKPDPPGPTAGELRHGNYTSFCANVLVGFEEMAYIEPLVEELGFGSPNAGTTVAWVTDLYEKGIITKEQLNGLDLKWGDVDAICELLKKIAYRDGIGNILADGYKWAIPAIGKGSENYAWHRHWEGDARRDPRVAGTWGVRRSNTPATLGDSATFCSFTAQPIPAVFGSINEAVRQYLNAACGWNLTAEDVEEIDLRNNLLARCFSLREGYLPERDDRVPDRCFDEPLTDKYGKTYVLDREDFDSELRELYVLDNLSENGLPKKADLNRLGLGYVISVLEPKGLVE